MHPIGYSYVAGGAWAGRRWSRTSPPGGASGWSRACSSTSEPSTFGRPFLGREVAMPLGIAPAGLHGLAHPRGRARRPRAPPRCRRPAVVSTAASAEPRGGGRGRAGRAALVPAVRRSRPWLHPFARRTCRSPPATARSPSPLTFRSSAARRGPPRTGSSCRVHGNLPWRRAAATASGRLSNRARSVSWGATRRNPNVELDAARAEGHPRAR